MMKRVSPEATPEDAQFSGLAISRETERKFLLLRKPQDPERFPNYHMLQSYIHIQGQGAEFYLNQRGNRHVLGVLGQRCALQINVMPDKARELAVFQPDTDGLLGNFNEARARTVNGEKYLVTIKGEGRIQRDEVNIEISRADYEALLKERLGKEVDKIRYHIALQDSARPAELDEYRFLTGTRPKLYVVEVEFPDLGTAEKFEPSGFPGWIGPVVEITDAADVSAAGIALRGVPPRIWDRVMY